MQYNINNAVYTAELSLPLPLRLQINMIKTCDRCYRESAGVVSYQQLLLYLLERQPMPASITDHAVATQNGITNHYYMLLKNVASGFHKMRNFELCKRQNFHLNSKTVGLRHKNLKMTLLQGQ